MFFFFVNHGIHNRIAIPGIVLRAKKLIHCSMFKLNHSIE